jgi:hypothetical protein
LPSPGLNPRTLGPTASTLLHHRGNYMICYETCQDRTTYRVVSLHRKTLQTPYLYY